MNMADAQTTDEEELIPVETPPEEPETEDTADSDDDGDDEDERLAGSEEESEEDITTSTNRERRKKRREQQRRAREAKEREIELLRQTTLQLQQRLAAVEGHAQSTTVSNLEQQIARTQAEIRQAEMIMAKATEAGNGEDVVAAMKIRDAAIADFHRLSGAKQQLSQQRQPAQPQVDPAVVNYAKQWMAANPWYDPNGADSDSALTKQIDAQIIREGYNPASRDYWEELTARVADALGESDEPAQRKPKRRAPPTGNTREHAPMSTKKEIYVTPERKQAMIEAGVWDDPVKRQRMLKAYQSYDSGSAR
jgi:hypothetical protein